MAETARFRTAGGWHIELGLPLSDRDKKRVERGELVRVDAEDKAIPLDHGTKPDPGEELAEGAERPRRRK